MPVATWSKFDSILAQALELPGAERLPFVERACEGDEALRENASRFLALAEQTKGFLEESIVDELGIEGPDTESPPQPLERGQRLGSYSVVRPLGQGGMGTVYLAERHDETFSGQVAIKVLCFGIRDEDQQKRFRKEIQILADLDHPGIVRLFDAGALADGRLYFVMHRVQGEPIDAFFRRHRPDLRTRIGILLEVCDAVRHAHERLVIHRDLKPGNILVGEDGIPKLLDFGVAKVLSQEQEAQTRFGGQLLTPSYASPEQFFGEEISTASDVYSLGVLLYEALTGCLPRALPAPTLAETARRFDRIPVPPSRLVKSAQRRTESNVPAEPRPFAVSSIEKDLDAIILQALRRNPVERYRSVGQLVADLERYLGGRPVRARPASGLYRLRKLAGRNRLATALTCLISAMLFTSTVAGTRLTLDLKAEQAATRAEAETAKRATELMIELFSAADPWRQSQKPLSVREVLDEGTSKILRGLESEPALHAQLSEAAGRTYLAIGDLEVAEPLLESALDIRSRRLAADSPNLAASLLQVGRLRVRQGEYVEAESLLLRALEVLCAASAQPCSAQPDSVFNETSVELSYLYARRGEVEQAAALARTALRAARDPLTANEIRLSRILGQISALKREIETGLRALERAADGARNLWGENNPRYALILSDLANIHSLAGHRLEGRRLHEQSLAIQEKALGPDHGQLAHARYNFVEHLLHYSEVSLAARHIELLNELPHGSLTPSLRSSIACADGRVQVWRNELEHAQERLEECLQGARQVLPAGHKDRGEPANYLARTWHRLGRPANALSLYHEALTEMDGAGTAESQSAARDLTLARLHRGKGLVLMDLGKLAEARLSWQQSLAVLDPWQHLGRSIEVIAERGLTLLLLGRTEQAEALIERALASGWREKRFVEILENASYPIPEVSP